MEHAVQLRRALLLACARTLSEQRAGEQLFFEVVSALAAATLARRPGGLAAEDLAQSWFERTWARFGADALHELGAMDTGGLVLSIRGELASMARASRLGEQRRNVPLRRYFRAQVDRALRATRFTLDRDGRVHVRDVEGLPAGRVAMPARPSVAGGRFRSTTPSPQWEAWIAQRVADAARPLRREELVDELLAAHDAGLTMVVDRFVWGETAEVERRLHASRTLSGVLASLVPVERTVVRMRAEGEAWELIARVTGVGPQRQRDVMKKARARLERVEGGT